MTIRNYQIIDNMEQGSDEWLALRKSKITATDACVIMGASHWKTKSQLYNEKKSDVNPLYTNERMQRGIELEPVARELFCLQHGVVVKPQIIVNDWAMASLDGMSDDGFTLVEIKCPNDKDHAIAVSGRVPDHYYPQLQHQMFVSGVDFMFYFSFDGFDGVAVRVDRDNDYIEKMGKEEMKFYECLINNTPPEPDEDDYILRSDLDWENVAYSYRTVSDQIKELEKEQEFLRNQLIELSGQSNCKGAGLALCQIERKGNVDYSKIPALKDIDLEQYRKPGVCCWRISAT